MEPVVPEGLLKQSASWSDLHRSQRAELSRSLRRCGLSYGEIRKLIPVPKGTLSHWCRDIELTSDQVAGIRARTTSPRGVPRDTQRKRRVEVAQIRRNALAEAPVLVKQSLWVAGTALYWGEGSKTTRRLQLANADPAVLRLFVRWVRSYLDSDGDFVMSLNLHADNNDRAAKRWWTHQLRLSPDFTKTFIKPDGTGHRKNTLPHGVCRVTLRRSADAFVTVMAWVEWLSEDENCPALISQVGR